MAADGSLDFPMAQCRVGNIARFDAEQEGLERETGFEPATSTLARLHSTAELFPRGASNYTSRKSYCVESNIKSTLRERLGMNR